MTENEKCSHDRSSEWRLLVLHFPLFTFFGQLGMSLGYTTVVEGFRVQHSHNLCVPRCGTAHSSTPLRVCQRELIGGGRRQVKEIPHECSS